MAENVRHLAAAGHGKLPPPIVHTPISTRGHASTETAAGSGMTLTPAAVKSAHPWTRQEDASYARMAATLLDALTVYEQQTADAGHLPATAQALARHVSRQLEDAAWAEWDKHLAVAFTLATAVVTPDLPARDRDLAADYQKMLLALAAGLAGWQRWTDLSQAATEQITAPVAAAYARRMEYAYLTMNDAVTAATDNWRRMRLGAQAAATRLKETEPPAGSPPVPA